MLDDATPEEMHLLDVLVPPPGPTWRRVVAWVVFLAAVIALTVGWQEGRVTPRLEEVRWVQYGGRGPVSVGVAFRNGSPVDIEIVGGPHDRAGLRRLGYVIGTVERDPIHGIDTIDSGIEWPIDEPDLAALVDRLDRDPFPLRLAPGQGVILTMFYDVVDCGRIRQIDERDVGVDLVVRMVGGPLRGIEHRREIRQFTASTSWPYEVAQHACGFPGPDGP